MCVCVCVCVCVCECVNVSVLAAATFSPRTRETPDLLSCCKKLFPLDKRLLGSGKSLWCAEKYFSDAKVIQSKR